jgi:iron complex transport system permease protein
VARIRGEISNISLILAGIIVTTVFSAMITLIEHIVADPYRLAGIVFWLMGSFSFSSWELTAQTAPLIVVGSVVLILMRWRLNLLSLGEEAATLGVNVRRERLIVVAAAALITSAAVSAVGIIGWVGLVVPHLVRMLVGTDNRILIPHSVTVGAAYMMTVDTVARTFPTGELPIGVVTALVGAPFFIYLLKKTGGLWQ